MYHSSGPCDIFPDFYDTNTFLLSNETHNYVNDMIGWFIEVYKDDKALTAFAVVVLKNENDFDRERKKIL